MSGEHNPALGPELPCGLPMTCPATGVLCSPKEGTPRAPFAFAQRDGFFLIRTKAPYEQCHVTPTWTCHLYSLFLTLRLLGARLVSLGPQTGVYRPVSTIFKPTICTIQARCPMPGWPPDVWGPPHIALGLLSEVSLLCHISRPAARLPRALGLLLNISATRHMSAALRGCCQEGE